MAGCVHLKRTGRLHPHIARLRAGRELSPRLAASLVVSAGILAAALASGAHTSLAWLALLPLFRVIQVLRPSSAFVAGGLWGSCLYFWGTGVVDAGIVPSVWSFVLLTVVAAAYTGAGACLTRRVGFSPFLLAVGWMLVEVATTPLGLGLGLLGGTLGDGVFMRVVGGLFGYAIAAFFVAITAASVFAIIIRARVRVWKPCQTLGSTVPHDTVWRRLELPFSTFQLRPSRPRSPPVEPIAIGMSFIA